MDNEAFRKLVADRTKQKSTKEIAREAVEDEFQRNGLGKRGRPDGYDSDSDDGITMKRGRRHDHQLEQQPKKQNQQDLYRDRAKERREGTSHQDYATSMKIMSDFQQATQEDATDAAILSKYLGGDEAHTHLVKGLDITLARKVKRDMGKAFAKKTLHTEIALDTPIQEKLPATTTRIFKSDDEAIKSLLSHAPSTSLGKSMSSYLQSKYAGIQHPDVIVESPAGMVLQRTSVIFNTNSDSHNMLKAWEKPQEVTEAAKINKNDIDTQGRILVDRHLVLQIKGVLNSIKYTTTPQHNITASRASKSSPPDAAETVDDDIFADAGYYSPPTNVLTDESTTFSKESVFDHLGITNSHLRSQLAQLPSQTIFPHADCKNLIDRDIFGARRLKTESKDGAGITSFQGDYGDEMDADFTGREDDDGDNDVKMHKKEKDTDTSDTAREYGRKQMNVKFSPVDTD